jgi:hypothetical protein
MALSELPLNFVLKSLASVSDRICQTEDDVMSPLWFKPRSWVYSARVMQRNGGGSAGFLALDLTETLFHH